MIPTNFSVKTPFPLPRLFKFGPLFLTFDRGAVEANWSFTVAIYFSFTLTVFCLVSQMRIL